jgi:hypothetical protein
MDANHFDILLRSFSASRPRRALIHLAAGLVLGGTAGTPWLSETEAKGKGKKKRRKPKGQGPSTPPTPPPGPSQCPATCPECQQCVNGQSCTPRNDGLGCGNTLCKECRGGQCVNKANGTSCNGEGQCVHGACYDPQGCKGKGAECQYLIDCCSADCVNGKCAVSGVGDYCRTSRDCNVDDVAGLNFCDTSFTCREPAIGQ